MVVRTLSFLIFFSLSFFFLGCCCGEKVKVIKYVNYLLKNGDTIESVSDRFGIPVEEIEAINIRPEDEDFQSGQFVKIPVGEKFYSPDAREYLKSNG